MNFFYYFFIILLVIFYLFISKTVMAVRWLKSCIFIYAQNSPYSRPSFTWIYLKKQTIIYRDSSLFYNNNLKTTYHYI